MPPIVSHPPAGSNHSKGSGFNTFTMQNAHGSHAASQVYSWRIKVGSMPNGYNYYLGTERLSNGNNQQDDTTVTGLPGSGVLCYTKVEYRQVQNGPWYSGATSSFRCN